MRFWIIGAIGFLHALIVPRDCIEAVSLLLGSGKMGSYSILQEVHFQFVEY